MTPMPSTRELCQLARQAGYEVIGEQQIRTNRWLLTLRDAEHAELLVLVQARRLVVAADVQDLAELVQLRRASRGILLVYGGTFSPAAQRTLAELPGAPLQLCGALPPAAPPAPDERIKVVAPHPIG
ncbi:MAG: hypothetical protein U0Z44_18620 [Kouleothrix sp.]